MIFVYVTLYTSTSINALHIEHLASCIKLFTWLQLVDHPTTDEGTRLGVEVKEHDIILVVYNIEETVVCVVVGR